MAMAWPANGQQMGAAAAAAVSSGAFCCVAVPKVTWPLGFSAITMRAWAAVGAAASPAPTNPRPPEALTNKTKVSALNGIESVRKNAADAAVVDLTE